MFQPRRGRCGRGQRAQLHTGRAERGFSRHPAPQELSRNWPGKPSTGRPESAPLSPTPARQPQRPQHPAPPAHPRRSTHAGGRRGPTRARGRRAQPPAKASPARRAAGRRRPTPAEAGTEGAATGGPGAGRAAATAAATPRPEPPEASPPARARNTATPTRAPRGTPDLPPAARAQRSRPRQRAARAAEPSPRKSSGFMFWCTPEHKNHREGTAALFGRTLQPLGVWGAGSRSCEEKQLENRPTPAPSVKSFRDRQQKATGATDCRTGAADRGGGQRQRSVRPRTPRAVASHAVRIAAQSVFPPGGRPIPFCPASEST